MIKKLNETDKYKRYSLRRDEVSGVVLPRNLQDSFKYKGETLTIQKNLKSDRFSLNIFKKGHRENEGEFRSCMMSLSRNEMNEIFETIKELLEEEGSGIF